MPVEFKDYYKTLGVSKDAAAADLKKAYRKLARQYHPDVNKSADASKRFKEVNEANEVLSDPGKRKRYDALGPDWERYAQGGPSHRGAGNGSGFTWSYGGAPGASPFGDDASGFSDFFRTVFGSGAAGMGGFGQPGTGARRRAAQQPRAADLEYPTEVTLAEAYKGTERVLELQGAEGTSRTLTVKVPAGVRDGQRIRLAGQAHAGDGGGRAGDLFLQVKVKPDPRFTRDGDDLRMELPVALHEAILGAEVIVPTLKGRVSLRIPPDTQNGRTIRLAGQGMPRAGGGSGDLYVSVKLVLPTKLSDKERAYVQEIAAAHGEDVRAHLL